MHAITRSGWIEVISGSMFSGKTEELLRRLRRSEIAGQSVAVYKPAVDDRYGETTIGTHTGRQWEATVVANEGDGPLEILDDEPFPEVVAVDEANFFSNALVEACNTLADGGTRVIVSGTDQTFRGEPFEPLPQLMATAEYVDKLQAICSQCGEPALGTSGSSKGSRHTSTTRRSSSAPRSRTRPGVATATCSGPASGLTANGRTSLTRGRRELRRTARGRSTRATTEAVRLPGWRAAG